MLSSYIHIKETWGVYAQKSLMFLILLMEKGQEVKKHSILVEVRSFLFRVPETFLMCIHKLSVKQQQCRIFSLPQQETSQSLLFFREFKPLNWSLPWRTLPFCQVLLPWQRWPWLRRWEVGSANRLKSWLGGSPMLLFKKWKFGFIQLDSCWEAMPQHWREKNFSGGNCLSF